jgi:4'-phosphopantetheinyl transferase
VHVWRFESGRGPTAAPGFTDCLSGEERARAQALRVEAARQSFVGSRAHLRHTLARYVGAGPAELRFETGEYGKPGLAGAGELRFSLSHSADLALLAVTSGREVGVDLEWHRSLPEARDIVAAHFARTEAAALAALPDAAFTPAFFDCWTRKEAFIKALGLGLSFPLNAFAVSLGQPALLLELHGVAPPPDAWTFRTLEVAEGCSATLVVQGAGSQVRCWCGRAGAIPMPA